MTKLLLIEDHPIFAEALSQALRERGNITSVNVVNSAEQAVQLVPELNVDMILVDVSLPKMSGIEFVSLIHEQRPEIPCLVISGHVSRRYARRAVEVGARGYAVKDSVSGIIEGINRILRGEIYMSKDITDD
ncbi:MAG: response regulator transcription factor [Anaerolineales bacterium]